MVIFAWKEGAMLFALALIPVIGLLLFIYFNDKKEKEPFGLLVILFFAGMGTVITAIIGELIGELIIAGMVGEEVILAEVLMAIFVVAPAEELGKFLVLRLITWKNKNFNYSYDAIVYAVFVSLGFAALENIGYVFQNGMLVAVMRMFTAVPGHACYAVFMGYFFSKAKYASVTKKNGKCATFMLLSIFVPIIAHGIYDAILAGGSTGEVVLSGISLILWLAFVTALFIVSIVMVIKASRNDYCIVTLPEQVQTVYRPAILGTWTCTCFSVNTLNFCPKCGRQRPISDTWYCPRCGTVSAYNFCGHCGLPRSAPQPAPQSVSQSQYQPQYRQPVNPHAAYMPPVSDPMQPPVR